MRMWQHRSWVARALLPLSWLYGLLLSVRRALYTLGLLQQARLPVPVIVVGNIFVGGTGKTPFVIWLVEELRARGWHPGVISRGYGAQHDQITEVHVDSGCQEAGDEPLLIMQRTGVPVVVGRRRVAAGRQLLRAHPEVDVSIHWQSKEDQILSLRHRTINVAFNRFVEPQSDLIVECISKEKIYLAVNSLSDLARLDSVDLRDCSDENFIMFPTKGRPGFYDKALELCREAGFVPHIAQEVGDITTGIALVASGFGAAFVTESATAIGVPNVVYMKLDELPGTPTVDLSCIYLNGLISPILQRFLDIARSLADRSSEP